MPTLGFKSMNPKSRSRFKARPRWQNQSGIPRIGGRKASNAASRARWDRRMAKYQSYGKKTVALNRLIDRLLHKLGLVHEYKPEPPPDGFKVEVK